MSSYDQNNQSFSDLILPIKSAISRYWIISWAPAFVLCSLVLFLSIRLPSYYSSDVLISVQQQKLTAKIVDAPSKDDQAERLQALIFEMISRPRLLNIIDQFDLYPKYRGANGKEAALKKLRAAIQITPESSTTGQRLAQTFRLSFSHEDPKTAYEVTKAISNLFIDESILSTKGETEGTVEFLDSQLRTARQKLEATEQAVQTYVRKNFGKLPEHLQAGIARLESAQTQLATNSQLIAAKTQKLDFLRRELQLEAKEVPVISSDSSASSANSPQESLAQLESALVVMRSKYSDQHPDVIAAKSRIEALRKQLGSGGKGAKPGTPRLFGSRASADAKGVRREIGSIEAELTALNEENIHLKKTIEQLEADIQEMPLREQELIKINRDYANVKANYERLMAAREEAGLQKDLISSQKGTQFKIVDPPALPIKPDGPPRLAIAGAGLVGGLLLLIAIPLLVFFTNGSFKFRDEVESELGIAIIGVIPPMETPRAMFLSRRAMNASLISSVVSFVAGSLLIFLLV